MSEQISSKYSVVDLFAGAGGLSFGFLQTGRFTVKAAFEMNSNAQQTYLRNHRIEKSNMYNDVEDALSEETKKKLGQVDIVIGGPPCQGFSNANRQKNHAISLNNSLVKKFVKAVLHLNPKAFLMENVSMLQSEVHRFYVAEDDRETIEQYNISTTDSQILLLEEEFVFDDVIGIVSDSDLITHYLWENDDYLTLNVVFKNCGNTEKLKAALAKHQRKLIKLAEALIAYEGNNYIIQQGRIAGKALLKYFKENTVDGLCEAIKPSILLQRMLSKAMEIKDNNIVVERFSVADGLVAHVKSMSVLDYITSILEADCNGYTINRGVLSAATFGVPQKRMRYVIMGIKKVITDSIELPVGTIKDEYFKTVRDAIWDLEEVETTIDIAVGNAGVPVGEAPDGTSVLGLSLRDSTTLYNHVCTATTERALERFQAIKQGQNFHSLKPELKTTYSNSERTQNTIYLRLNYDEPSGTVVNVRKSMWIHPTHDRALSIREAARLQTFPDSFVFYGTKDSQYQQVGNAVPPILAKAIAEHLCCYLDSGIMKTTPEEKRGVEVGLI
ncbi:DNA cytosine methyltransferase [Bacillus sp. FJAT-27445]|uniref:DNA cytosine methyltransferase n=1 Tax=Bacillus sp. FJAT-27445 TaxID=1679166 RepID=UPI000743C35A|nr:DNA cytosine methyltransferase [Bacillus sp. FJAT-27445]